MPRHNEHEEAWALQLVSNGSGVWPLRNHPLYDEAYVGFPLESGDEVRVYLRKEGKSVRVYKFRLVPENYGQPPLAL